LKQLAASKGRIFCSKNWASSRLGCLASAPWAIAAKAAAAAVTCKPIATLDNMVDITMSLQMF
jgi:hypothetical protein